MITWMDFIFDDVLGPVLNVSGSVSKPRERQELPSSVMEDASDAEIQETRQELRTARVSSLEVSAQVGMEATERVPAPSRSRGEG